jgi:hypothetical protein
VKTKANLLEIVNALASAGSFTGGLNGWEKQRDENRDNRDHNQQLNQCETLAVSCH